MLQLENVVDKTAQKRGQRKSFRRVRDVLVVTGVMLLPVSTLALASVVFAI